MRRIWATAFIALVFFSISFALSFWLSNLGLNGQTIPKNLNSILFSPDFSVEHQVKAETESNLDSGCDQQLYLGIFRDFAAVFQGQPGAGGILLELTDVSILKMPEFEIENLRQGIPFTDEEEKYSILEGLHFPR
ncbi:MAG: hypothetical protein GX994_01485 [Firmicutes bacterium]|nr:hypothetical protein [Bacillota bacterium]